ncbi:MAG: hypothetical protein KF778_08690 [Rhodocyclaceae bacterium]|nr:hypothetical protein [Rhodocyclaceae bacterium]
MRTTLDLPDDILRRAKITAVERGSTLRQLVIDALKNEMEQPSRISRKRLTTPPVKLAADSPLRTLSPDEVKRLDTQADADAEVKRANALDR